MTGLGVNHSITMAEFDYVDTGTTVNNDTFFGIGANCNLTGERPSVGGGSVVAACIGGAIAARGYAYQGGALGAEQGEIHGLNVVAGVTIGDSTPTHYYDHAGIETDLVGCVGCAVKVRLGNYVVDFGDGSNGPTEQGSTVDAAFAVATVVGATGWKYGIDFVGPPISGGNPINDSGTVLGSSNGVPTVAGNGIDLNNFVIAGAAFRAPGGSWYVTGAGDEIAHSVVTGALAVDTVLAADAIIALRAAGIEQWKIYREATTNRFIILDDTNSSPVLTAAPASGLVTLGEGANAMRIDSVGSVTTPGISTVAVIAGSVCMSATFEMIYKVGANCF
jgi:hypothetical protein